MCIAWLIARISLLLLLSLSPWPDVLSNPSSLTNIPYVLSQGCGPEAGAPLGAPTATLYHVAASLVRCCRPAVSPSDLPCVPIFCLVLGGLGRGLQRKKQGFQLLFLPLLPSRQDLGTLLMSSRLGREGSAGSKEWLIFPKQANAQKCLCT